MAYQDDETPQKTGGGISPFFFLGVALSLVFIGGLGVVAYAGISWQWLIVPLLIVAACVGVGLWLSIQRRKALHLNDEFAKLRFRWTRAYGLAAASFIVMPVWLLMRYEKSLPEGWARIVTTVTPHPDDFAKGILFVVGTIGLCSLVADGIWQLRHK